MGLNLLRFSYWLDHGQIPCTAIISGERNSASFHLAKREHFHSAYFKISNKTDALDHLCRNQGLKPEEIAFVFDDILDISMAAKCGLRILVNRPGASLFHKYIIKHKLADYITGSFSGHYAVRETCELLMGFREIFDRALEERSAFSVNYKAYLEARNEISTFFFSRADEQIIEQNP
jgi:3-deoxy-D-manno-octulosonate 8-phosphate phosphatase (KDO 8-P phosphatase)